MSISVRELLEAGAHFGHQTHRWNPKMRPYIFGARNGIHIIDLQKTALLWAEARRNIISTVSRGGKVLFVGTKTQAQEVVREEAARAGHFYVDRRWLGGMLTNFKTIKSRIDRLEKLDALNTTGRAEAMMKKERVKLEKERVKLERSLCGIKRMKKVPKLVVVVDPKKEHIAVREARKLNIPVLAITDTNCDPEGIDFVIPANDDALKSIRLFLAAVADACIEGEKAFEARIQEEARRKQEEERKKAAEKEASKEANSSGTPQSKSETSAESPSIEPVEEAERLAASSKP